MPNEEQQQRPRAVWTGSGAVCDGFIAKGDADDVLVRCARCGCAPWLHKDPKPEGGPCR
jgi:hypothetical protein